MTSPAQAEAQLRSAATGFDNLFANELDAAREVFKTDDSPYHLLGLGVCAFLEAALGMEVPKMDEASRCLSLSESGAKKQYKAAKAAVSSHRFQPGLEWDILHADAIILLGMTHALSESYRGYLQCFAHSKFNTLYKSVYPNGIDAYATPATTPAPSRKGSSPSINSSVSSPTSTKSGFLGLWGGSGPKSSASAVNPTVTGQPPNGPVEELILSGTAFGYGLFNLVFSLLPAKVRGVVGFLGFQHDRKLALQALAVSATYSDVHAVFSGLVLMTWHGIVLLMAGYQADEEHRLKQYRIIVDKIEARYPTGALWILNKAKILRMSYDAEGAQRLLEEGLKPQRPHSFSQADTLLMFELAWVLLSQRQYEEAAKTFIKLTKLNSWSHATYYFLAAGCYISLNKTDKAQELMDAIPALLEKRKVLTGKDLPTEVLIKKKLAFYKKKQKARGRDESKFVEAIKISPAEELGIFWNTHGRISHAVAEAHIRDWSALTPPLTIKSPYIPDEPSVPAVHPDLTSVDELALRALLLGIVHRTLEAFEPSRLFLREVQTLSRDVDAATWLAGVAMFESAVLDLKEAEARGRALSENAGSAEVRELWVKAIREASEKLDQALALSNNNADLSSRLDGRINMLRDEIVAKQEMLGIAQR